MKCGLLLHVSHVAWSVCLCVWTYRDAVQSADSCGFKEPCIRWGQDKTNLVAAGRGLQSGDAAFYQITLDTCYVYWHSIISPICIQIREIKRVLRSFMIKLQSRDAKEKVSLEWRLVALSIDRLFFVVYVTTIITSILVISLTCILYSDARTAESRNRRSC